MKKLSLELLAKAVADGRKAQNITQSDLAKATGINRSILSRLESQGYTPSVDQLLALYFYTLLKIQLYLLLFYQ